MIPLEVLLEATQPGKPFTWNKETDMSVGGITSVLVDLLAIILCMFTSKTGTKKEKEGIKQQ